MSRTTAEGAVAVELPEGSDVDAFLRAALECGRAVLSVSPRRESLEDFFIRQASDLPGRRADRAGARDPPAAHARRSPT